MSVPTGSPSLLDTAVERFYALVVADPRLAPWFDGVDVGRLRRHQAEFLGADLDGGSTRFDLRGAHAGLGIDEGHVRGLMTAVDDLRDQVVEVRPL